MAAAFDISDPCWFPAQLDLQAGTIQFIYTSRDALAAAPFLDQRFAPTGAAQVAVPLADLFSAPLPESPAPHWIFHTAFCCSTLMARALDVPGKSFSYKEPGILMELANAKRMAAQTGLTDAQLAQMTGLVFGLLSRRFGPDEAIIIKPTNPANPLAADALARGHKAVFMVSELKDFLISVLKKGEGCKAFMRQLYNIFALDPAPLGAIPQRQALTFTDLQIAALVQRHQMEAMTALAGQYSAQVRAMDGNDLPLRASAHLSGVAAYFGLGWDAETASAQAASDVFSRNSKFADETYGADARAEDAAAIEALHKDALDVTLGWARTLKLGGEADMPPGAPLA